MSGSPNSILKSQITGGRQRMTIEWRKSRMSIKFSWRNSVTWLDCQLLHAFYLTVEVVTKLPENWRNDFSHSGMKGRFGRRSAEKLADKMCDSVSATATFAHLLQQRGPWPACNLSNFLDQCLQVGEIVETFSQLPQLLWSLEASVRLHCHCCHKKSSSSA